MSSALPVRVAIFEDSKLMREAYNAILSGTPGFVVTGVFPDFSDLAFKIRQSNPDVILMDIEMPGMDGIEATRQVSSLQPSARILIQTVFEQDDKIFEAICAGASGYILKSSSPAQLVQAVQEVQAGGSPMTPAVASKVLRLFQQFAPQRPIANEEVELSDREKEILTLMVQGKTPRQIGETIFLSYETVRTYVKKIYKKLHVATAAGAVAKAMKEGLV